MNMSNLVKHAEVEMKVAGLYDEDAGYGGMMPEAVMELVKVFSEQGHSGFSANLCLSIFNKVARFEPLAPLTGEDDEWREVEDGLWQNKRCSHVFRGSDGRAYDIHGRTFREPNGACYTGPGSRVYVEFPYTPTTEYVDVDAKKEVQ